jgi:type I restriction enzyme S subunit
MEFKYSSNWTVSLLDDITDRGSGHTPNQSEHTYWNGGIKWVSLADSKRLDDLFISTTEKEISELGLENSSAVKHPAGTVILSRDAGVGKSAILKEEMAVSQHFIVWRCSPKNILNNVYLYYWLQMMKPEFERMAVGSTIKTIGLPYFKKLRITYPPLPEQCKIAEILGAWDESIALLEKLIAAKRKLKQGLMQQLLTGKKRFKEFEGSEWKNIKINKLMVESRIAGSTGLDAKKITVKIYCKGVFPKEEKRFGSENTKYYKRSSGQFIYSKLDFLNGAFGIVPEELDGYETTLDLPCFDFYKNVSPKFIFYFVGREEFYSRFKNQAIGGRKARRVSTDEFLNTEIRIPSLPEQEKIASVLSAADAEISNLEKQLATYKQQKRGLMQQLLTGKTRVRVN